MAQAGGCFICPNYAAVYQACLDPTDNSINGGWIKLPGTTKWALTPNVTESTTLVTSDTNGNLVKPCPDTVEWSLENRSALCDVDGSWLFQFIPMLGSTVCKWYFLTWDDNPPADILDQLETAFPDGAIPTRSDGPGAGNTLSALDVYGLLAAGFANPNGMELDAANVGTAVENEWSIAVQVGPYEPNFTSLACPYQQQI